VKLLVAVSAKPFEPAALDAVCRLAEGGDVTLLHVGEAAAPPAVHEALERLRAAGAHVTLVVAPGDPAKRIVERARGENADLVVVRGHDRHPGLLRRVFGDTVEKVVETSDRPVLALRGRADPAGKRILLAAGRPSPRMLDVTVQLAKATSSPVTLVHVTPGEDEGLFGSRQFESRAPAGAATQQVAQEDRTTQRNLKALESRGAQVDVRYREGLVESELVDEANSDGYWLTVVRARPVGFLHRLVLGHSFTEDLVRHVETSVLILR
jgi:nucleotide-binding universal stress UspA family protein